MYGFVLSLCLGLVGSVLDTVISVDVALLLGLVFGIDIGRLMLNNMLEQQCL